MTKMCPFLAIGQTASNNTRCVRAGCGVWNETWGACGFRLFLGPAEFAVPPRHQQKEKEDNA